MAGVFAGAAVENEEAAREITRQLFRGYLLREPTDAELSIHSATLMRAGPDALAREFAYCDEAARFDSPFSVHPSCSMPITNPPEVQADPGRTAVQISGHFRNWERTFPLLLEKIIRPLQADVFVHTWNTRGTKVNSGSIAPTPDANKIDVATGIAALENVRRFEIEDCGQFLSADSNDPSYLLYGIVYRGRLGGSAEPKYINSQLHSVYRACVLREAAESEGQFVYDTVIKIRADYGPTGEVPAGEWRPPQGTIWVPGGCANHAHPSCRRCRSGVHTGPHGSDVCDVFAIGNSAAMSHYCRLGTVAGTLYGRLQAENQTHMAAERQRKFPAFDKWRTVNIWSAGGHKYHCYYPERLFREHLGDYRLLPSGLSGSILK